MKLEICQECGPTIKAPLTQEVFKHAGPRLAECDFKSYAENVTKGAWREQILSLESRRNKQHVPVCVVVLCCCVVLCCVVVLYCAVLLCCVALRSVPATEGFSDRCEKAVRDAFTLTDTCWEQCMLGDVKWGRGKNHKNARLKVYLGKY